MRNLLLLLGIFLICSCSPAPRGAMLQLADLQPLPDPPPTAVAPLRVSVAAVVSPRGTVESYRPLLAYLSRRLGRPVELVQRRTYAETNALIEQGQVDLAFVCTSAYIEGREQFGMELLVAPQVHNQTVYHSLLIVPAASNAHAMADLRGRVFAFTDPISYSGRVYPTALVAQLGSTPASFFERVFYTYNHDNAIRAVAEGVANGAAVDSLVFEYAMLRDPTLAARVRVIHRSPPFGIPPVVVSPHIRPQLKATLQDLLLTMADDAAGQEALALLGIDRFAVITDDAYDTARAVIQSIGPLTP